MRTMPKAVDAVNKMAACRAALPRIVNLTAGGGLHGITAVHPAIFNTLIKIDTKCDNEPRLMVEILSLYSCRLAAHLRP